MVREPGEVLLLFAIKTWKVSGSRLKRTALFFSVHRYGLWDLKVYAFYALYAEQTRLVSRYSVRFPYRYILNVLRARPCLLLS